MKKEFRVLRVRQEKKSGLYFIKFEMDGKSFCVSHTGKGPGLYTYTEAQEIKKRLEACEDPFKEFKIYGHSLKNHRHDNPTTPQSN